MNPSVLLEDTHWVALNKPAGWVINDSKTAHNNPTLQDWIRENFSFEIAHDDLLRNGIVHRLDKDTSGVILVAKDENTFGLLQKQFQDRTIQKMYHTLVHGKLESGGEISLPIIRNPKNRTRFTTSSEGRESRTDFSFLKLHKHGNEFFTELLVYPKTGRTHQIRVHLSAIHHPIVSDVLYAGRNVVKTDLLWCPRMFLHAEMLSFVDPFSQKNIEVKAPLPKDLADALLHMK